MYGGGRKPLSVVIFYRMNVTPSMALNMCGSSHLTISYLPKDEKGDLGLSPLIGLIT